MNDNSRAQSNQMTQMRNEMKGAGLSAGGRRVYMDDKMRLRVYKS